MYLFDTTSNNGIKLKNILRRLAARTKKALEKFQSSRISRRRRWRSL